jgi:GTP-binding nuclear protein Ran
MMGDGGVGKTTFVERIVTGKFNSSTKMTIGVDFQVIQQVVELEDEDPIQLTISVWDLGGESQFRFILPSYIKGANGGLLMYDASRYLTSTHLPDWVDLWRKHTKEGIPLILIGSKLDVVQRGSMSLIEPEINRLKEDLQIDTHFLVSSKTGENVTDVLELIAKEMVKSL